MTLDEFKSLLDEALAFYNSEHSGAQIDEGVAGGLGAIRYDVVQVLAEAQKERARKNLGLDAIPAGGGGGNFEAVFDVTPASEIEAAYQAGKTITMNNNGVIYYLRERTSETRFEFTTPPYLIEMFSAIYIYTAVVENFSWSMSSTKAESQSNKVTSISTASTNTQYPSAKAVYDFVMENSAGGGSGADLLNENGIIKQEYLPEGYPYGGPPTEIIAFPEQELMYSEDMGGFVIFSGANYDDFPTPATYTVTWNGATYETQGKEITVMGENAKVIGNMAVVPGSSDTGEPFSVMFLPPSLAAEEGIEAVVVPFDGSTTATMGITRSDSNIKVIAQKFLPEGYPYSEEKDALLLPETTVEIIDAQGVLLNALGLEIGRTYTVTWNGVEYSCPAFEAGIDDDTDGIFEIAMGVAIGNPGAIGGADNGKPFIIIEAYPEIAAQVGAPVLIQSLDELTTVSLSISGVGILNTYIAEKFLPPGYPYFVPGGEVVLEETTITSNVPFTTPLNINKGYAYAINFNGTQYTSTARLATLAEGTALYLGNGRIVGIGADTGEPYCILNAYGVGIAVFTEGSGDTATVKIVQAGTYVPMDARYIPSDAKQLLVTLIGTGSESQGPVTVERISHTYADIAAAFYAGSMVFLEYKVGENPVTIEVYALSAMSYNDALFTRISYSTASGTTAEQIKVGADGGVYYWRLGLSSQVANSLVLTSPNGRTFMVTVDDGGTLRTKEVTE